MPQIINTNIASLNAQRNLDKSQGSNTTALQRLSSGLRINSAKDDAAGLAISTRFTTQVKGLNVAIRNAGDGISLAQTAEGALASISENLQRIRELAVQSANATNSDTDRLALQQEVEALKAEITRTGDEADFNGRKLLDGSFAATFQVGANAGQTVDVQISELTANKLGSTEQSGVSARGTSNALANGDLVINGVQIDSSVASDDTSSVFNNGASAIAKAAAINDASEQTGVSAVIDENTLAGATMSSGAFSGRIYINDIEINITTTNNTTELERSTSRQAVVAAINAKADQTGVTAVDSGSDNNGVVLVAADGRNITLYGTTAAGDITNETGLSGFSASSFTTATTANTFSGGYTLVAEGDVKEINISGGNGTGTGDLRNSGLNEGSYDRSVAVATSEVVSTGSTGLSTTSLWSSTDSVAGVSTGLSAINSYNVDKIVQQYAGLQDGDLVINGITIGASSSLDDTASDTSAASSAAQGSGIAIAAAINKVSDQTGVTAEVNATVVIGATAAPATAATAGTALAIRINNVDLGEVLSQGDADLDRAAVAAVINQKSGQTGVVAEDNGVSVTLTAADGRNISVAIAAGTAGTGATFGLDANVDGIGEISSATTTATRTALLANAFQVSLTTGTTGTIGTTDSLAVAETTYSTVTLSSAREISVEGGTAGNRGLVDSGFTQGDFGQGESGQFVKDIDVSTFEGAQDAIEAVDNALKDVAFQRAELGAIQNRFESTISNLQITSENLTASNSRIADADFAAETAELARTQVLQQAGISVLAQANQRPQQVLSLLG